TRDLIRRRFPLVDDRKFDWLWTITQATVKADEEHKFEVHYGFSPEDIFTLAATVQEMKRRTWRPLKKDPLHYLLRAVQLVYLGALKDEDLATFEREIIFDGLLNDVFKDWLANGELNEWELSTYYAALKEEIFAEFSQMQQETITTEIPLERLNENDEVI